LYELLGRGRAPGQQHQNRRVDAEQRRHREEADAGCAKQVSGVHGPLS
jgi:hypothetical protein